MLEGDRLHLYDWLHEHGDERIAEYVMSRLNTAPINELASKDDLRQVETSLNQSISGIEAAVARLADLREADRAEATAQREADRAERAAQREADRAEVKNQFRWLVGVVVTLGVTILAAVVTSMAVPLASG